jgi:hypothetical protein
MKGEYKIMMLDNDKHVYTIHLDGESKTEAEALVKDLIQHGYMGKGITAQIHGNLLNIAVTITE